MQCKSAEERQAAWVIYSGELAEARRDGDAAAFTNIVAEFCKAIRSFS